MHDAAATFTHEKARKFDKDVKIENKSYNTKHDVTNMEIHTSDFYIICLNLNDFYR